MLLPFLIVYKKKNIYTKYTSITEMMKVTGLLRLLISVSHLLKVCGSLHLVDKMCPASMVSEGDGFMTFEVKNCLKITVGDLGDII